MNPVQELLAECRSLDVRLTLDRDGRLSIDAPQLVLTQELLDRLRDSKSEILRFLHGDSADDSAIPDIETIDYIHADEIRPCPTCGTLDQWLSAAGDCFGRTPGVWRCSTCDPPTASRRMIEATERIRASQRRRR